MLRVGGKLLCKKTFSRSLHSSTYFFAYRRNIKFGTDIKPKVQGQPVIPPKRQQETRNHSEVSFQVLNDEVRNAVRIDQDFIDEIGIDRITKALNYSNLSESEDILKKLDENDLVDQIFNGNCIEKIKQLNNFNKFQSIFYSNKNFVKLLKTIDGRHIFAASVEEIALDYSKNNNNPKVSVFDTSKGSSFSCKSQDIISNYFEKINTSTEFRSLCTEEPSCHFIHDLVKSSSGMIKYGYFKKEINLLADQILSDIEFYLKNKNSCFINIC